MSEHYAVVDVASYATKVTNEGYVSSLQATDARSLNEGKAVTSEACIRTAIPPGWVEWEGVDPRSYGYSVKPENGDYLVYAHPPSEGCDGIYNPGWGCGIALKIPDHCTLYAGQGAYCCNAAMTPLFGVVRVVYPGSGGEATKWPYCPLP